MAENELSTARSARSTRCQRHAIAAILVLGIVAAGPVAAQTSQAEPLAPELNGLGTLHFPVTTSDPAAQRFIDQGVKLLYAFNHTESLRAFREAARRDKGLAMAYWGQAMAL